MNYTETQFRMRSLPQSFDALGQKDMMIRFLLKYKNLPRIFLPDHRPSLVLSPTLSFHSLDTQGVSDFINNGPGNDFLKRLGTSSRTRRKDFVLERSTESS